MASPPGLVLSGFVDLFSGYFVGVRREAAGKMLQDEAGTWAVKAGQDYAKHHHQVPSQLFLDTTLRFRRPGRSGYRAKTGVRVRAAVAIHFATVNDGAACGSYPDSWVSASSCLVEPCGL